MASDNIYVQYVGFQSIGPRVHLLYARSSERELASSFLTVAKESVRLALGGLSRMHLGSRSNRFYSQG